MIPNRTKTARAWSALLWAILPCTLAASPAALGDLRKGQVLVGLHNGMTRVLRVYDEVGLQQEEFSDGSGSPHFGGVFDGFRNELYATTSIGQFGQINNLVVFDGAHPHAPLRTIDLDAQGMLGVISMVRDRAGNIYLGDKQVLAGTTFIRKLSLSLVLVNTFPVTTSTPGISSLAVTRDGALAYYVTSGAVQRYNLATQTQLTSLFLPEGAQRLRLLAPFDAGAELLVATTNISSTLARVRRIDAAGNTLQTYDFPGENRLAGIAPTPDGLSFWAVSSTSAPANPGNLYRVGLLSGLIEIGPISVGSSQPVDSLAVIDRNPKGRAAAPPSLPPILFPLPILAGGMPRLIRLERP